MFIYLSKKIAIPNNTKLNTIAWNKENGYIAVGGEDGLLKVLKLDGGGDHESKSRGLIAASNLSMNQTLEGHSDNIRVITWNETHKKLTSSDQNGVIIVWMLYKGAWYEEMINNRKKSTVVDMTWSSDGLKICIVYEDGAVIVGSVDGNRIWGKELKSIQLAAVRWSPDGKLLLFGLRNGQVHLYDNLGNFVMKIDIFCTDPTNPETSIVGIDWYDGKHGYIHALCPVLAICYENGRLQLMCNENDTDPIALHTGILAVSANWNHNGSLIAVSGKTIEEDKHSNVVQFYNPLGDHLRTLKVPGNSISCCVWEGTSLRVALAVDSYVYFANIRPDYKWCYFKNTVVFTSCRPLKAGVCVSFWDVTNNQCHTKFVPILLSIAGYGDHCVLVVGSEENENAPYGLLLCNTLGTPVDGKYVKIEIQWVTMNSTHVIAASKSNFIIWQYKTPKFFNILGNKSRCRTYHIDDTPSGAVEVIQDLDRNVEFPVNTYATTDPICAITCSNKLLVVARESGLLQFYALPHVALYNRIKSSSRPHKLALNCNSTKLSIIDMSGVLTVTDIAEANREKLERKDVWGMCWASDNPHLLAIMEKTRMYIFKGHNPEEPLASSGYLCSFRDLEVKAVLLDDVMDTPEKPSEDRFLKLEVKSLRDTRQLLEKVGIQEAAQFIEDNPHPRLWRLLAEAALKQMDLATAESAFIRSNNYSGILFVKKLGQINNDVIKKAYVATYFKQYDEAEKLYLEADRRDMALVMRQTLGDWFRVIQIMKNGASATDLALEMAYNSAAEYFAQFNNWSAAVEYYELAKNRNKLVECYYHLNDYESIIKMIDQSPEGDPILRQIGDTFSTEGAYNLATEAYTKYGDIKSAINLCIIYNKWDQAKDLAKKHNIPDVYKLFVNRSLNLIDKKLLINAVEINMQTQNFLEASKIVFAITKTLKKDPKRMKQAYVFAAKLTEEDFKRRGNRDTGSSENIWTGAEAFHLYLLALEHLYAGRIHAAMLATYQLTDYTEFVDPKIVFSLLALTAFLNDSLLMCSKAFTQFRTIEDLSEEELVEYDQLALEVFKERKPIDRKVVQMTCSNCQESVPDWSTTCSNCAMRYPICVASGQSIIQESVPLWVCNECHHYAVRTIITYRRICPLCHASVQ